MDIYVKILLTIALIGVITAFTGIYTIENKAMQTLCKTIEVLCFVAAFICLIVRIWTI